jgi:hypothetical protein
MTRLKITEEIREAARKLLKLKLGADEMREAKRYLMRSSGYKLSLANRCRLEDIVSGKRKVIDALWWNRIHEVVDQSKLDKLERLADPARNSSEHERELAGRKAAELKARRPPGAPPQAPPLPDNIADFVRMRKPSKRRPAPQSDGGVNRRAALPMPLPDDGGVNSGGVSFETPGEPEPVNTTKKPRSADRHREPNRDRHSPGYMAEYMRRRRGRAGGAL